MANEHGGGKKEEAEEPIIDNKRGRKKEEIEAERAFERNLKRYVPQKPFLYAHDLPMRKKTLPPPPTPFLELPFLLHEPLFRVIFLR